MGYWWWIQQDAIQRVIGVIPKTASVSVNINAAVRVRSRKPDRRDLDIVLVPEVVVACPHEPIAVASFEDKAKVVVFARRVVGCRK